MKKLSVLLFSLLLSLQSFAGQTATFFRVWQGFHRPDTTRTEFIDALPDFMTIADGLYGLALNDYFVALAPETKSAKIPDEFALLAFPDEQEYRRIRATPEGQAYTAAHVELFDMTISKSAPYERGLPAALVSGNSYDLSPATVDWSKGYTLFFLGTRKAGVSAEQFLADLHAHVAMAQKNLVPEGMKGYIVIANEDYEAAYINWESEEAMTNAFAKVAGKDVGADAGRFMDIVMWEPVKSLSIPVKPGFFQSSQDPLF